jgi:hypothetical protein
MQCDLCSHDSKLLERQRSTCFELVFQERDLLVITDSNDEFWTPPNLLVDRQNLLLNLSNQVICILLAWHFDCT